MLDLMGIKKAMQIAISGMIEAMKAQHSDAPQGFWDKFQKEMDSDEFITLLIPCMTNITRWKI